MEQSEIEELLRGADEEFGNNKIKSRDYLA